MDVNFWLIAVAFCVAFNATKDKLNWDKAKMSRAGVWLRWRHEAKQSKTALQAQKAVETEVGRTANVARHRSGILKQHHRFVIISSFRRELSE